MQNRIIKFRAWNNELKRMGYSSDKHFKTEGWWGVILMSGEDLGEIPMQYTGLKDKNGKDIYESDKILFDGEERIVVWGGLGWELQKKDSAAHVWEIWQPELTEVTGNIWES